MNQSLESIGLWEYRIFNIAGAGEPEQRPGIRATVGLFDALRVQPALGRIFTAEEDAQSQRVVVLSDAVWRSQFAADPGALGKTLRLNGEPYEVIGVMPPTFQFPRYGIGGWIPMSFVAQDRERDSHSFWAAGRLRDGVTFESAQAEFAQIGAVLASQHRENEDETSVVTRMSDVGIARLRSMLSTLLGAVALVLLIACVNVANLQLSQAVNRRREFVLRLALGAGLGRLSRQLLFEALALALLGGAGGVAIAWLGTHSLGALLGPGFLDLPMRGELEAAIDLRVLAFTFAISIACALLFGLAPIVGVRRAGLQAALHGGSRGSTRTAMGARRLLVAAEVALALVVLCGAGLLLKSLAGLLHVDPGLDPARVLAMQVSLPQADAYGRAERQTFCADLDRSVAEEGLVFVAHGATSHLPLSGANAGRGFTIEGRPAPASDNRPSANYRVTCPGYFRALGIPMVAGRDFSPDDRKTGVVIINRLVADQYWPQQNPVGQRLKIGGYTSELPWLTIVGVAENVHHFGLESAPLREIYVPYGQSAWPVLTIIAKARGEITPAVQTAMRDVLRRIDPSLPAASIRTMDAVIDGSMTWLTSFLRLLGVFAGVGLALAAIGVYGVLVYYVSQRTRELGVRVALGAPRGAVVSMVLRQSLWPVLVGIALGALGSYWTNRLLSDSLFEVKPGDPVVLAAIACVLIVVGLTASWLPARRAASIDPLIALRED
jgi:putative ABC transport system permease protein